LVLVVQAQLALVVAHALTDKQDIHQDFIIIMELVVAVEQVLTVATLLLLMVVVQAAVLVV
jgi:hypothetical protein